MKIKHIVYSAVLASLVFAGCQTASQKGAAPYKMTTVSEKNAVFEAEIAYPQFAGFDDLNALIKSRTLGAYNDFKSSAQKTRKEIESAKSASAEKIPPFEYKAVCDSIIVSDKYISMLFTAYRYEGGAHGETLLDSITYDKALKKEVSITEASGLSVKDIATQCKDYFMKHLNYGGLDRRRHHTGSGQLPDFHVRRQKAHRLFRALYGRAVFRRRAKSYDCSRPVKLSDTIC